KFYLKNNHVSALGNLNMEMVKEDGKWFVMDHGSNTILEAEEVLSSDDIRSLDREREFDVSPDIPSINPLGGIADMAATIAPDNGEDPNKRKKKKAR
ncbi:MAG: hypothetical protein ACTILG_12380, partial [Sphingobacterium sp.]